MLNHVIYITPLEELIDRKKYLLKVLDELNPYNKVLEDLKTIFDNMPEGYNYRIVPYISSNFVKIDGIISATKKARDALYNNPKHIVFSRADTEKAKLVAESETLETTIKTTTLNIDSFENLKYLAIAYYYSFAQTYLTILESKILKTPLPVNNTKIASGLLNTIFDLCFKEYKQSYDQSRTATTLPIQYGCFLLESALELRDNDATILQYKKKYIENNKKLFDQYGCYDLFNATTYFFLYQEILDKITLNPSFNDKNLQLTPYLKLMTNEMRKYIGKLQPLIKSNNNPNIPSLLFSLYWEIPKIIDIINTYRQKNPPSIIARLKEMKNLDDLIPETYAKLKTIFENFKSDESKYHDKSEVLEKYLSKIFYALAVYLADCSYDKVLLENTILTQRCPGGISNNTINKKSFLINSYDNMIKFVNFAIDLRQNLIPKILEYTKQYTNYFVDIVNGANDDSSTAVKKEIIKTDISSYEEHNLNTLKIYHQTLCSTISAKKVTSEFLVTTNTEAERDAKQAADELIREEEAKKVQPTKPKPNTKRKKQGKNSSCTNNKNSIVKSTNSKQQELPKEEKKATEPKGKVTLYSPEQWTLYIEAAKTYRENKSEGIPLFEKLLDTQKKNPFITSLCYTILAEYYYLVAIDTNISSLDISTPYKNFPSIHDNLTKAQFNFETALDYTNYAFAYLNLCTPKTQEDKLSVSNLAFSIGWNITGKPKQLGIQAGLDKTMELSHDVYECFESGRIKKRGTTLEDIKKWKTNCFNPNWHPSIEAQYHFAAKLLRDSCYYLKDKCNSMKKFHHIEENYNAQNINNSGFAFSFN